MLVPKQRRLSRAITLDLLAQFTRETGLAITIYMPADITLSYAGGLLAAVPGAKAVAEDILKAVANSTTGAALFWGERHKCLFSPPFPLAAESVQEGYQVAPLRSMLERELIVAVVIVRMGMYGIGVFRGEDLLSSKVGTGLVHGRHRQGGSSAHRFERHREKQIEYFFSRVCTHAQENIEPYVRGLDYVVYGGERNTIRSFREHCRFLSMTDSRVLPRLLNVREPRQNALEQSIADVWSSTMISWHEQATC
ncbi:MAG: hypothetical protein HYX87_04525 [Chloroflexi bacterium]|nr:hypothetical protein [Chloroflexota bacterium]